MGDPIYRGRERRPLLAVSGLYHYQSATLRTRLGGFLFGATDFRSIFTDGMEFCLLVTKITRKDDRPTKKGALFRSQE